MPKQFTLEDRLRLAVVTGIGEPYLYQCLTGRRNMGPAEAMRVEIATKGELSRRDLCQKTYAAIWPELAEAKAA